MSVSSIIYILSKLSWSWDKGTLGTTDSLNLADTGYIISQRNIIIIMTQIMSTSWKQHDIEPSWQFTNQFIILAKCHTSWIALLILHLHQGQFFGFYLQRGSMLHWFGEKQQIILGVVAGTGIKILGLTMCFIVVVVVVQISIPP